MLNSIGNLTLNSIGNLTLNSIGDLILNSIGDLILNNIGDLILNKIWGLILNKIWGLTLSNNIIIDNGIKFLISFERINLDVMVIIQGGASTDINILSLLIQERQKVLLQLI